MVLVTAALALAFLTVLLNACGGPGLRLSSAQSVAKDFRPARSNQHSPRSSSVVIELLVARLAGDRRGGDDRRDLRHRGLLGDRTRDRCDVGGARARTAGVAVGPPNDVVQVGQGPALTRLAARLPTLRPSNPHTPGKSQLCRASWWTASGWALTYASSNDAVTSAGAVQ